MPAQKRERPTKKDLALVAQTLGYSSAKDAFDVLETNGVTSESFNPERFDEYVAVLTTHAETLGSILNTLEKEKAKTGNVLGSEVDLPARSTTILQRWGQRPWLFRPVAKDKRGKFRKMDDREDLRKGEVMVYEGVTKEEHLTTVEEAYDAMGRGESSSPSVRVGDTVASGVVRDDGGD
jgi:hypothetical protein